MSDYYWPSDMLNDYKNMRVPTQGSQVTVAVNRYRNNSNALEKGGTQEALKIKDALMSLGSKSILARAGGAQNYVDVFTGKGSPDSIARVLSLFDEYATKFVDRFRKMGGPPGKCASFLADDGLSTAEKLQAISNEYMGLDCNGFVGNGLRIADHSLKLGPQSSPREVYGKRVASRKAVDEIEWWDVVIWANFSHIAVIEGEAGSSAPWYEMCQSADGGPRLNEYYFERSSPGAFRRTGGIPAKDVGGDTYVISLW